ncbi:MAG: efflux RND transporter permease subunit, partial [Myxococcales bacterium]|nr:efflux RND transporter permease subunit [Myxococcales bacterium]
SYPGADAEVIDETIVARLEGAVSGVEGVETMTSRSREGSASITIEVAGGHDVEHVLGELKAAVDAVSDLPEGMEDAPTVAIRTRTAQVASVAVTGPMSGQDLKRYCERVRQTLLAEPDISLVSLAGFSTHQIKIRLDPAAMTRFGVGVSEVAEAIRAQSLDTPLGSLQTLEGELLVRYSDKRATPAELGAIVLKTGEAGGEVRLDSIAQLEDTFAVEADQTFFNGQRAGTLVVNKTGAQDSLEVFAAIERALERERARKPEGVTLTIVSDVTSVISDRLALLVTNGLQGLVLVFLTLWLFFNLRLAFWVAAGLPVSFLGAICVMYYTGQSLNMMTMMGLLIALGLLMDDAIVLAENVASHRQRGKPPLQAAVDGVREVAGGVVSSFVTTVCVFVPLTAIEGRIGRTLQVIPAVLVAVLAVSLLEAFFVLPNHLGHIPREGRPSRARARFDAAFERVRERGLGRLVDLAIRFRYATLGLTAAALIIAAGLVSSGALRYQAFPDTEGDNVEYSLALSPGTSLAETQREVERVVAAAERVSAELSPQQPDGQALVKHTSVRFNYNREVEETGPHLATVSVDLLSVEVRATTLAEFSQAWRAAIGPVKKSAVAKVGAGGRRGPGGNPIEVRLQGDDLERLEEAARAVQGWFRELEGTSDLAYDLQAGAPQVRVRMRPGASASGLRADALTQHIKAALSGVRVESMFVGGEEFELFVELERSGRDTIADLEQLMIPITGADSVATVTPLAALAEVELTRAYATVNRAAGIRTVTVTGNIDRERLNLAATIARFTAERVPTLEQEFPDVRVAIGGEIEQSEATVGSMERGLIIGLFAIFVLLAVQFRNYVEPVVVMLAIPFAFAGVVYGSMLIGAPLSTQAVLGFVSLAGVVVNDSILLMLFIRDARARGLTPIDAARGASRDRFRAVLLTSVTTIAGLIPLMFETSRQAQSLIPVATSIVFGITASTVLVLVVLPATYAALGDLGLARVEVEPGDELEDAPESRTA